MKELDVNPHAGDWDVVEERLRNYTTRKPNRHVVCCGTGRRAPGKAEY